MSLDQTAEAGISQITAGGALAAAILAVMACALPFIFGV